MIYQAPVVKGKGRGKPSGFPTFNLVIPENFPEKFGIYAARVWVDEQPYGGALHYGPIPVYGEETPTLEIYVLDYDSDVPVDTVRFELAKYLRPIQSFPTPEDLHRQIAEDVAEIKKILA